MPGIKSVCWFACRRRPGKRPRVAEDGGEAERKPLRMGEDGAAMRAGGPTARGSRSGVPFTQGVGGFWVLGAADDLR